MDKRKYLYVVRHGQSESNVDHTKRGPDSPLTEKGIEQARTVAYRFKKVPIEVVVASTMTRAKNTAEIIAETIGSKEIIFSDLAREIDHPKEATGLSWNDPRTHHILRDIYWDNDGKKRPSGEESFEDISLRVIKLLDLIAKRPEEHILLVSHGRFMKALLGEVLLTESFSSKDFWRLLEHIGANNSGVSVFNYFPEDTYFKKPKWWLVSWNDTTHLD